MVVCVCIHNLHLISFVAYSNTNKDMTQPVVVCTAVNCHEPHHHTNNFNNSKKRQESQMQTLQKID